MSYLRHYATGWFLYYGFRGIVGRHQFARYYAQLKTEPLPRTKS